MSPRVQHYLRVRKVQRNHFQRLLIRDKGQAETFPRCPLRPISLDLLSTICIHDQKHNEVHEALRQSILETGTRPETQEEVDQEHTVGYLLDPI